MGYTFRNLGWQFVTTVTTPQLQQAVEKKKKKNCNADRTDWTVWKFKMSTVKFPGVQFDCDGIGLQFSRQCLMGYIHHYWVIARSSRVLRQRERDREWKKRGMSWEEGEGWRVSERWRKRKIKRYGLKTITGEIAPNVWKCDIRKGLLCY